MQRLTLPAIILGLFIGMVAPAQATALSVSDTPTYVALGDSVAAGAGLPSNYAASSEDELCDRSPQAYPYQVATALGTSVTQLACSGAKVDEGIYDDQEVDDTEIAPQLDRAFQNGTPDVITITVGANDGRWVQAMRDCYLWRCGSDFDVYRDKAYRADLRVELSWTLYRIEQMSNGNPPQVLLSGYYSPFEDINCLGTNRITAAESAWMNTESTKLNQAIRSVVPHFSFAEYVPVDFSNHGLCSSEPWIQGMDDDAPFHPTAAGQTAIARSFTTTLER